MPDKKALGPSLKLTNEQLDEAAEITEEDVELVNEAWVKSVPAVYRNLLVATAE